MVKEALILLLLETRNRVGPQQVNSVQHYSAGKLSSHSETEFQIQDRKPWSRENEAGKDTAALNNQGKTSLNQVKCALFWEM